MTPLCTGSPGTGRRGADCAVMLARRQGGAGETGAEAAGGRAGAAAGDGGRSSSRRLTRLLMYSASPPAALPPLSGAGAGAPLSGAAASGAAASGASVSGTTVAASLWPYWSSRWYLPSAGRRSSSVGGGSTMVGGVRTPCRPRAGGGRNTASCRDTRASQLDGRGAAQCSAACHPARSTARRT